MFLGIDLGTTYSAGAYISEDGEAKIATNLEGSNTTPSVVYFESEDNVVVGQIAKEMAVANPNDVIALVKNSMGKLKKDGTPQDFITSKGVFAPEYISAQILMKIVQDARTFLNLDEDIKDVVVTIPAYFDDAQRKATEDAIAIAGLNRLALINEPTAAALYYATKFGIADSNVLIYDLGGGTFDVTIVRIQKDGNVEVQSTGGLFKVGGSFFDKEIAQRVAAHINDTLGIDITTEEYADLYQEILVKAEKCKIALSSSEKTILTIRVNSTPVSIPFSRSDIDDIVRSLYGRTEAVMDKALKEAKLEASDIDKILLVGGSSRIPFIAEHIEEYFNKKPSREVNPDEVVALGAALYGKQLTSETEVKRTIIDVCSHSLGIAALDPKTGENYNNIMIPKNTKLPASVEQVYAFAEDDVEDIYINVLEGERRELKYSSEICATNVKLPKKLRKNERVHVRLEMDRHQILHIFIRIPSAGNVETEVSFDRKSNMNEAQIFEWKKSAVKVKEKNDEKTGFGKKFFSNFLNKSEEPKAEPKKKPEVKKDKSKEIPKIVRDSMEGIVGMNEVKECLRDLKNRNDANKRNAHNNDYDNHCIAILGQSGMGMTTAAHRTAKVLYELGISSTEAPILATYEDIVKTDEQSTIQAIQDLYQSALGGVLIIDDFHEFYNENENFAGMVAIKYLTRAYQKANRNLTIIIAGEIDAVLKLFDVKDDFERLFSTYTIQLLGYTPDEYVQLLHQYANSRGYVIDEDANPYLEAHFKRNCGNPDFGYFYSVESLFDRAKTDVANKASAKRHATDYDYSIIRLENFGITDKVKSLEELKEELNNLTGLKNAKDKINEIIKIQENFVLKAKEEGRDINVGLGSMHMVFTGSPGTGKTTVARLVGDIYRELGVLKTGQFIEVTRKDLISDIVGRTKDLVANAVERAVGGILFIDEAYSLYQDENDSFGKEAVDTLVPLIENYRNDMMVIMAGYTKDMAEFMDKANTGLSSRFNTYVEFDDYNIDELMEIFTYNLKQDNYRMEGAASEPVKELILEKMKNPKFGNARGVRNIYEAIKRRQMARLADVKDWGEDEEHIIREVDIRPSADEAQEKSLEELMEELNELTGLRNVKTQVNTMINTVKVNQARAQSGNKSNVVGTMHMIFAGSAGTGKTTVARLIGQIYKKLGLLGEGRTIEVAKADLVANFVGQTAPKTQSVINRSIGNVLFIDEAYTLVGDSFGQEAIDTLLKGIEDYRDSMVVILAGYDDKMLEFLSTNEGLTSRFKNWIKFDDYTLDEMYEIFESAAKHKSFTIEPDAVDSIKALIEKKSKAKDFANARGVRNLVEDVILQVNNRLAPRVIAGEELDDTTLSTITRADIGVDASGSESTRERTLEELLAELNSLTGLAGVKKQVNSMINTVKVNKLRAENGMHTGSLGTMHMIFAGSAGTGKTTVARLIGQIYKKLGLLDGGETIETARNNLVAGYVGQTAEKTQAVLDRSIGNVLFIDEAYTLVGKGENDFGQEAIDTLLKGIEDHRDSMVVILAGYTDKMQAFLDTNEGLSSRFKNWIMFEDYTNDEMYQIFEYMIQKEGMTIDPEAIDVIKNHIAVQSTAHNFGNARGIRNIVDDVKIHLNDRLSMAIDMGMEITGEVLTTIKAEDVY